MSHLVQEGIRLFKAYQFEESQIVFEKIIKNDKDNKQALLFLGKIHAKSQNYGVAMNYYNRVLELDKNNNEAEIGIKLIKNILQLTNNYYYENPYTDDDLYDFD
jgi:tetratricopeptide (TPR) repeat protein